LYRRLNESYPKKLYFHLGVNAGFFSEFNNMLLAMLYCLDRGLQFVLYSADANFKARLGWRDFFEPFCPETEDGFHHANNYRWLKLYHPRRKIRLFFMKRRLGLDFLTHDVWRKFKSKRFAAKRFVIPELGIDGDILEALLTLHRVAWRYNEGARLAVAAKKAALGLPASYLGLHIRGGDKVIEHDVYGPERYIEAAKAISPTRKAFVLTDDYTIFERLESVYPEWSFWTTCRPDERGYFHDEYQKLDAAAKADQLMNLFAAMDILGGAEHFIGTFSSNPGMNMGMRLPKDRIHGIDFGSWKTHW
jgi:hypothetical protein